MTPTDAAAATGLISTNELGDRFDVAASIAGLELFAATLDRYGEPRYGVADQAGAAIVREVQQRSGQVIAAAVGLPAPVWQSLLNDNDSYSVSVAIDRPIVGIGASSALYHPPLSRLLGVDVVIPEFSEVANAVGAAIGAVRFQMTASITAPKRAGFVLHRPGATVSFDSLEDAVAQAEERLEHHLRSRYETSGIASEAVPVSVSITRHDNVVNIDGAEFFVECVLEGTLTHDVGTNRSAESS